MWLGLWPAGIQNHHVRRQALERLAQRHLSKVRGERLVGATVQYDLDPRLLANGCEDRCYRCCMGL
jgi:hypothetical protein